MTKLQKIRPLSPEKLAVKINPEKLGFKTTEELKPLGATFGQSRAVDALMFGIKMDGKGFNIFLTGEPGTGKTSILKDILHSEARKFPPPNDWCYLYNFDNPDKPLAFAFPAGEGSAFRNDMTEMITELKRTLPKFKESELYLQKRHAIDMLYSKKEDALLDKLRKKARRAGIDLDVIDGEFVVKMIEENGEVVEIDDLSELPDKKRREYENRLMEFQGEIDKYLTQQKKLVKEHEEKLAEIERNNVLQVCKDNLASMRERYKHVKGLSGYLDRVEQELPGRILSYLSSTEEESNGGLLSIFGALSNSSVSDPEEYLLPFNVNLLVNNSNIKGAPVIIEPNPTYINLIGRIEYREQAGWLSTDFMQIRPGALHLANGGFLVLQALDLLKNPFSWDALKRALRTKAVHIEPPAVEPSARVLKTLKPQPIPLDIKVIVVGSEETFYWLWEMDEDFARLFKVRADFDASMPVNKTNIIKLARFLSKIANEENKLHLTAAGVARIVEEGCREAEHKNRTSAKLSSIVDLYHESEFWAKREGAKFVDKPHVDRAVASRAERLARLQEEILREIEEKELLIDISGEAVGQINGIAVYELSDYAFGVPARITARAYTGRQGIINIERESELAGPIHNKATLILQGFIGGLFAQDKPLSLSVSITFEQVYGLVEGDSATCAELYAILSAIANVPIKQGFAVTGSLNQRGEVQPIGAVNEKIEGIFRVCERLGLNGEQGVIIPVQNVRHLALSDDVVEAVREGLFKIYAIRRVEDAVPILMGIPAGVRRNGSFYPRNSLYARVDERLREIQETLKRSD